VNLEPLLIGIVGAIIGTLGSLTVALTVQRREFGRRARDAARAVYFELGANHINIFVALEYGAFGVLSSTTYERLLPELATWLPPDELQALALAYMGHAGYRQAAEDATLPAAARKAILQALADTHRAAVERLRQRAFTPAEIQTLMDHATVEQQRLMEAANRGSS
jgi:hypothetical protein